jgi:hypothetical protein
MQSCMKVLCYFLPNSSGSLLTSTVMHFYEPTNTDRDSFMDINDQGRLIRVNEEVTDLELALTFTEHSLVVPMKPSLLPITSFCHPFQIPVNAFRVEGDPHEYPTELSSMITRNELSLFYCFLSKSILRSLLPCFGIVSMCLWCPYCLLCHSKPRLIENYRSQITFPSMRKGE